MCGWTTNHPEHAAVSPDRAVEIWRGGGRKEGMNEGKGKKGEGMEREGWSNRASERGREGRV